MFVVLVDVVNVHWRQQGIIVYDLETRILFKVIIFNKETNCFVFVRQFRAPVYMHKHMRGDKNLTGEDGITLELCAGIIDKKEKSVAQHAVEEVQEETGYKVTLDDLEPVSAHLGSIGICGTHLRVFYVEVTNAQVLTNLK